MGVDFRDVIRANVPLFQKLARGYYEAVEAEQAPRSSWVVLFKCKNDRNAKPVAIKLPARAQAIAAAFWSNFRAFAKKPNCPLHRNALCLAEEVKELEATEAAKVKKRYDDNGEIQDLS